MDLKGVLVVADVAEKKSPDFGAFKWEHHRTSWVFPWFFHGFSWAELEVFMGKNFERHGGFPFTFMFHSWKRNQESHWVDRVTFSEVKGLLTA